MMRSWHEGCVQRVTSSLRRSAMGETEAGTAMIRLRNVEKSYPFKGGRTWVLRQISLDIAEGDFVTIMGPSGSGKSTLLAILGMLDGEFDGEYYFDGKPVHKSSVKERNRLHKENIGFVFQHFHLLDDLTVSTRISTSRCRIGTCRARSARRASPKSSTASRSSARRTFTP